jgi:hypothetical protein
MIMRSVKRWQVADSGGPGGALLEAPLAVVRRRRRPVRRPAVEGLQRSVGGDAQLGTGGDNLLAAGRSQERGRRRHNSGHPPRRKKNSATKKNKNNVVSYYYSAEFLIIIDSAFLLLFIYNFRQPGLPLVQ